MLKARKPKTNLKIAVVRFNYKTAKDILQELVDAYDDTGCEGCGVIGVETINKARVFLGKEPLDTEY